MTHEEAPRFGTAVVPADGLGPGYAGVLAKGPDGACVYYSRSQGCTVYAKRPDVCVRWVPIPPVCGYRPDPMKQLGLFRLREDAA